MEQDEQLIEQLGIGNLSPEQQQRVLDELRMQIGEALSADLTEEQQSEYQSIIDGDQSVIEHWLSNHAPDYKSTIAYEELTKGFDEDPDKVPADKVYASIAWVQVNSPNLGATVERIKQEIKANVDKYKD